MLKFLLLSLFALFFVGCSSYEESSLNDNQTKYLSISKAPIAYEVPIFQKLVLEFNAELNVSSVTHNSAYIDDGNGTAIGLYHGISTDVNKTKIIFTPYQYLKPSQTYTMIVTTDVKSVNGLSLSQDFNTSFTTANDLVDDSNLTFEAFKPSSSLKAELLTDISIQFSKNISDAALYDGSLASGGSMIEVKDSTGSLVSGNINFFNSIVTFIPNSSLDFNETYSVNLQGDISDMYGNIYNGNKSWSFSTVESAATSIPLNIGFKNLYTFAIDKPATTIRAMQTPNKENVLAVSTQNSIDFFDVNISYSGYPSLLAKTSFAIPSQINTIEVCDNQYLMVGTMNDGIYILELNETITQHTLLSVTGNNAVSGVTCAKDVNNSTDMIYAVGPKLGMDIFKLENDVISFVKNVAVSDGIPLKVVSSSYWEQSLPYDFKRKVYVSDYKNGVRIYDKNGTSLRVVDLNGSTKGIAVLNTDTLSLLLTTNSIGISKVMDFDGNIIDTITIDMLSSASDIGFFKEEIPTTATPFKVYLSDLNKGVMVLDVGYNGVIKEALLSLSSTKTVSIATIKDTSLELLATLSSEGVIDMYNAVYDIYEPTHYSNPNENGFFNNNDDNITITFYEFLDPLTVDASSFRIEDISGNIPVDVNFSLAPSADAKVFILNPDVNMTSYDYNITIKGEIADRVGNLYNAGNDYKFTIYNNNF